MYTLTQLVALGVGAAFGVRFFTFCVASLNDFMMGVLRGWVLAYPDSFGRLRPYLLRQFGLHDCELCRETHETHHICRPLWVVGPPMPPMAPPPPPPPKDDAA